MTNPGFSQRPHVAPPPTRIALGLQRIAGDPVRAGTASQRWVTAAVAAALALGLAALFVPFTEDVQGLAVVRLDDRPGQLRPRLLLVLPGRILPYLTPGQPVRFSVDGVRGSYQTATLGAVAQEALGGSEVRRLLGPHQEALVGGDGPFALADVAVDPDFQASGVRYRYRPGMRATAWVGLGRSSLFRSIFRPR